MMGVTGRMLRLPGLNRRFAGRQRRLALICECIQQEGTALHPLQIARKTGLAMADVSLSLEDTPELFVRMPTRPGGYTRFRMVSTLAALPLDEIQAVIGRHARHEKIVGGITGGLVAVMFALVLLTMLPWTSLGGYHADQPIRPGGPTLDAVRADLTLAAPGTIIQPPAALPAPPPRPERPRRPERPDFLADPGPAGND